MLNVDQIEVVLRQAERADIAGVASRGSFGRSPAGQDEHLGDVDTAADAEMVAIGALSELASCAETTIHFGAQRHQSPTVSLPADDSQDHVSLAL